MYKLDSQELKGLREMIINTSTKKLNEYRKLNETELGAPFVFLGDSMIEYFNLNTYLPGIDAINRGIAGATSPFILSKLNMILGNLEPNHIYISIGSNDLVLHEATVQKVVENIKVLLKELTNRCPEAHITYLSTTPVISVKSKLYKKIYIAGRENHELKTINEQIKIYADLNQLGFINLFDALLDLNGYLDETYTMDGIHLNPKGYMVYASIIKEKLKSMIECSSE